MFSNISIDGNSIISQNRSPLRYRRPPLLRNRLVLYRVVFKEQGFLLGKNKQFHGG